MSGWGTGPSAEQLAAIQQLSPEAVRAYMMSEGWRPHETERETNLWTLAEDADEFEVLVPTDRRLRDFPLRMYEVLRTLAIVQDRPLPTVLADLANTGVDRMILRLLPAGPPGTIPLVNGAGAVSGMRELVMSATYASTLERPLLVQHRRPQPVQDFVRRVRLGTPQAGSWVIAAEVAIPEADLDPSSDGVLPFARRVSLQLHRGVRATLTAAGEVLRDDSLEPFLRRAEEGVSANTCEALADMGRDDTPFEIRFSWAQRLPPQVGAGRFRFDRQTIRTIRSAGEALRNSLLEGLVDIVGPVARLRRESGGEGTATVTGRVRTRYGEADQPVRVRLTPVQHERAIEAYQSRRYLRVVGEARQGRVEIAHRVEVVEPSTLDDYDR
jgi:hypothetical protein